MIDVLVWENTIWGIPYPSVNGYAVCVFNYGETILDFFDVLETINEAAVTILKSPPDWQTYNDEDETTILLKKTFDDITIGGGPITDDLQYGLQKEIKTPALNDMETVTSYGWHKILDIT